MSGASDWEAEAANWIAWARKPGHDDYWYYRDAFFDEIVPLPGRLTLELGCGEGRVARDLTARGHRVVGVDTSPTLLRHARDAHRGGAYVLCDARSLPFADQSFDLAVAYNSLMDVDGLDQAVREAARVLTPEGRLCMCVTHPMCDAGRFESREPDAPFIIGGNYLVRRRFEGTFERDGLIMTFRGRALDRTPPRTLGERGFHGEVRRIGGALAPDPRVPPHPGPEGLTYSPSSFLAIRVPSTMLTSFRWATSHERVRRPQSGVTWIRPGSPNTSTA